VAGQCGVNPQTNCPTGGPTSGPNAASLAPFQVSPPKKCVPVPTTLFYIRASNAGGCTEILFVQVKLQPNISDYEAVVYSKIGLGTRWWSDPRTPQDQTGPATHAGHTFAYGAASYTVPQGYLAWDVGAGSSGNPAGCTDKAPPPGVYGQAGWGLVNSSGGGSGRGTIGIRGPTKNRYHASFNEVVSGTASGAADYVASFEQTPPGGGCASTFLGERGRRSATAWPTGTGSVHGHFRLVARFYARNHLSHAICSYLINVSSGHTFARAALFWKNR
jgi:hypothetical protein